MRVDLVRIRCRVRRHLVKFQIPCRVACIAVCYSSQFSNLSSGTFSKSRRFAVRKSALFATTIQAIFKSIEPF